MRLNSKHKNKKTGIVFELTLIQQPTKDKHGNDLQWLILKNAAAKYPISVSLDEFEKQYQAV